MLAGNWGGSGTPGGRDIPAYSGAVLARPDAAP